MDLATRRAIEVDKYRVAYQDENYRMGERRTIDASAQLAVLPPGSLLDVGCGRGEMLDVALSMGFRPVRGFEVTAALIAARDDVQFGAAHALPADDGSFDYVTCFDVFEHLVEEDVEPALREFGRVARCGVVLAINNHNSVNHRTGDVLHVTLKPYDEWEQIIRRVLGGAVTRVPCVVSEVWRVEFGTG